MKERISELEAQCAAMREALEVEDAHRPWDGEGLRAALATDAGKAMLEDMRQQSAAFDKLIADRDAERRQWKDRAEKAERELALSEAFDKDWDESERRVRADMRERAAKVADEFGGENRTWTCEAIAAAIRALPLEGET